MLRIEQRRLIAPLFCHRPVTGRLIVRVLAQKNKQDRRLGWISFECHSTEMVKKRLNKKII
jgi:hypothetical protein